MRRPWAFICAFIFINLLCAASILLTYLTTTDSPLVRVQNAAVVSSHLGVERERKRERERKKEREREKKKNY